MTKKHSKKHLALAMSSAVAAGFSFSPLLNAAQNPFALTDLTNGYLEVAEGEKKAEGSCGEGKCGGKMKMEMEKKAEGSCGEGKCGEGKCAGKKKADSSSAGSEEAAPAAD